MNDKISSITISLSLIFYLTIGQTALSAQPSVGDLYDIDQGEKFRSATLMHNDDGGTSPNWQQPFSLFENADGTFLIAIVEQLSPNQRGVKTVYRIVYSLKVQSGPNETTLNGFDCAFLDQKPVITFFNATTKIATGYFAISKDTIFKRRWFVDEASECQPSVD